MSAIVPELVFPAIRRFGGFFGETFVDEIERLRQTQWMSRQDLERESGRRLGALLRHSYSNVPYYRRLFDSRGISPDDIGSVSDLAAVPITGREELRAGFPGDVSAANLPEKRKQAAFTSGFTGAPLRFYRDTKGKALWDAVFYRQREWFDMQMRDTMIRIALPNHYYSHNRFIETAQKLLVGKEVVHLSSLDIGADSLIRAIEKIPRRRRYFIWSFPSALAIVAKELIDRKLELPRKPCAVLCGAEVLTEARSAAIEKAFGLRPFNRYGTMETPNIAQSCPQNPELMHINAEAVIVRVVDDCGKELACGETGRVVYTDLVNHVMPFINYDIGDRAVSGPPCNCGRGLPTLARIDGRAGTVIVLPGGRRLSEAAVNPMIRLSGLLNRYFSEMQIVQRAPDAIEIHVVPMEGLTDEHCRMLEEHFIKMLQSPVSVRVHKVDKIAGAGTGKRPLIKGLA